MDACVQALEKMSIKEKVWAECAKIPSGKVISYGEIARKLGTSARAVGQAMKLSPGIFGGVPCHRVIRSDGRIGGFNRGVEEKIKLLKREGIEIKERRVDARHFIEK